MKRGVQYSPVWMFFRLMNKAAAGSNAVMSTSQSASTESRPHSERSSEVGAATNPADNIEQPLSDSPVVVCVVCNQRFPPSYAKNTTNCRKHLKNHHREIYEQLRLSTGPQSRVAADPIPASVPDKWNVIACTVQETHMWWFLRVTSNDPNRMKKHASEVGFKKIVGPDDRLVHYVNRRIDEYLKTLQHEGNYHSWFQKGYEELYKPAWNALINSSAEERKAEQYVRCTAFLTYLGHVASHEVQHEFLFLGPKCLGTVCYAIEGGALIIYNTGCYAPPALHAFCLHYLVRFVARKNNCSVIHWLVRDHLVSSLGDLRWALQPKAEEPSVYFQYFGTYIPPSVPHEAFTCRLEDYRPLRADFTI